MNQILVTGEEYGKQSKRQKQAKQPKQPREKKVLGINTIVIFYAISIIILGMCMITGSVYAKEKINETVEANTKPTIQLNRNDDNNTIEILVKHIRGIAQVSYKWNDGEEVIIQGNNQKELTKEIDLIGGTNTLTLKVTEENGQTVTHSKTFTAGNIPEIELQAVSNGVKIIASSQDKIDYITYKWDEQTEQKITVEKEKYEGTINAPTGRHSLTVEVVDINGNIGTKEQVIIGDTQPTLKIAADYIDDKLSFVIDAEDDEKITKVEVTINGEIQIIDVNDKAYHGTFEIVEGLNNIKVVVYNLNGLQTQQEAYVRN